MKIIVTEVKSGDIVVLWRDNSPFAHMVRATGEYAFMCFHTDNTWNGYFNSVQDLLQNTLKSHSDSEIRVYESVKEMMLDCASAYK